MNKTYIGRKTIEEHIKKLCDTIKVDGREYTSVVGIQRGGLNLSMPLAQCLNIKHKSIKISFYEDDKKRSDPIVDLFDLDINQRPFILADDLIDSGATIKYFKEKYNLTQGIDFIIAVLYWNTQNEAKIIPDYYAEVKPDSWIVFPWECEDCEKLSG